MFNFSLSSIVEETAHLGKMCKRSIFWWLLITNLIALDYGYQVEQPKLELFYDKFRLSISDDPDIKWVEFNVNINKEFQLYEQPQLNCNAPFPKKRRWSCKIEKELLDSDIVYMWLRVQHNDIQYRSKKDGFSVGALRRGERNFIITAPTTTTTAPTATTTEPRVPQPTFRGGTIGQCSTSITESSNGGQICQGDLIFEDNFDQFMSKYWISEIRIPSDKVDAEFSFYNGSVDVNNGILRIEAKLYAKDKAQGTLDLTERCTATDINECWFNVINRFYPPISSGHINTKEYFKFKYGRIEVKAKLPKGDWLFPLISLQPADDKYGTEAYRNGEMRVAYIRGNEEIIWNNANIGGVRLFGGAILDKVDENRTRYMSNVTLSQVNGISGHFGDAFHVYSLTWNRDELVLSVDDFEYGKIAVDFKNTVKGRLWKSRDPPNAPLNQMFYISLGLAAGGHGDFPQNIKNKPWENSAPKAINTFLKESEMWFPTWTQPTLDVDYVRVYAI